MDRKALALLSQLNPRDVERVLGRMRQHADRKRDRLLARRNALARKVAALDREIAALGDGHAPRRRRAKRGSRIVPAPKPQGRKASSRDVAYAILAKKTKPMKLEHLAKAVLASGKVKSSSPAFARTLGISMRGDRRFRKVGRGLYVAFGE